MEKKSEPISPTDQIDWAEKAIRWIQAYWRQLLGWGLIGTAFFSLLALVGLTHSGFLYYLTTLTKQCIGWGAFLIMLGIGTTGLDLLKPIRYWIRPNYLLAAIITSILALPLTHIFTNATFSAAYRGEAGGLLGWALSEPLLRYFGVFPTYLFYLLTMITIAMTIHRITLNDVVRWLIWGAGYLQRWSEQLLSADEYLPPRQQTSSLPTKNDTPTSPATFSQLINLLDPNRAPPPSDDDLNKSAATIEQTLAHFGLEAKVVSKRRGPTITQFGIKPGYHIRAENEDGTEKRQKVRVSQIANLRADLALALAVPRLRIEAPVPGRGIVGIELPNPEPSYVFLREVMESEEFTKQNNPLAIALGKDVAGEPLTVNLAKMPHLLIAGTTGAGKSICLKALVACLIANNSPQTVRLVMIDPKRVEMVRFNGLPHLLGPAEVEGERIIGVLRWLVQEMENRYSIFAQEGARNIATYNQKLVDQALQLPYLVVVIDELADLMVQFSAETERTLCRLAQMARATGIHLVIATQRPSTDVITGLIKANFPARIAFAVATSIDSRVVIDTTGAEQLLGNGDMLFVNSDASVPLRVQGCYVSDAEIDRLVNFWRKKSQDQPEGKPPWESVLARMKLLGNNEAEMERAIEICEEFDNVTASLLQRKLRIGYPRAARLIEQLQEIGLIDGRSKKEKDSAESREHLS